MSTNAVLRKRTAPEMVEANGNGSAETLPEAKRAKETPGGDNNNDWKPSPFYQGGSYQLKMALLSLCRAHRNGYKVYLGQPVLNGVPPGVDNFLLKYEDTKLQRWMFRMVHIKHQLFNDDDELTPADFLEPHGRLSIPAYYGVQREMSTANKWPSWSSLDQFLVLVHHGVSLPLLRSKEIVLTEVGQRDPMFDPAESAGGTPLQLYRIEKLPNSLRKQLGELFGIRQLATELVKCFLNNGKLALNNDVFSKFHYALIAEKVLVLGPTGCAKACKLNHMFLAKQFSSPRAAALHQAMMDVLPELDPGGEQWPTSQLRAIQASIPFGVAKSELAVALLPDEKSPTFSLEEFCQKFVIGVRMPTEAHLTQMVEAELGKIFTLIDGSIVFERLWTWMLTQMPLQSGYHRSSVFGKELLDSVHQKLREWNLLGIMTTHPLQKLGLEDRYDLVVNGVEPLAEALNSAQLLLVSTSCPSLSFMNVCQALKRRSDDDYAAVDIHRLMSLSTYALAAMKTRATYWLVVEMASLTEAETPKAVQVLRQLVHDATSTGNGQSKKVALVAEPDDAICSKVLHGKTYKEYQDGGVSFCGLHERARARLLDCQVTFQKQLVRLRDLVGDAEGLDLSESMVNGLIRGLPVTIGRPLRLENLRDTLAYYIPRRLQLYRHFDRDCLEGAEDKLLILASGLKARHEVLRVVAETRVCKFEDGSWEKAPSDLKVILFDSADTAELNFEKIGAKYSDRTLHWYQFDGNFCAQKKPAIGVRETEQRRPLVKIITSEAGMGKSVSLSSLALREKKSKKLHWVLLVNLPEFQRYLVDNSCFDDLHSVMEFLCVSNGLTEDYECSILEHCLTRVGKAVLFLDGFDEIDLRARASVLQAIRVLRKSAMLETVWLTTQQASLCPGLESDLVDYRYELLALQLLDQQTFLVKYWTARLKDGGTTVDEPRLSATVQNFLRQLEDRDSGQLTPWLKNPLQIQMLADIYWHDVQLVLAEKAASKAVILSTNLPTSILALIERYVEEKVLQGLAVRDSVKTFQQERAQFMEVLGALAVIRLFADEAHRHGFTEADSTADASSADEEVLLATKLLLRDDEGRWCFVHQTVARYFVARHLSRMLTDAGGAEECHEQAIALLKDIYFTEPFDQIRPFMDHILVQGHKLFEAVLCEDPDAACAIVKGGGDALKVRDELGRTALHLAALYSPDNVFLQLISAADEADLKFDVNAEDWMGFAPLCYALVLVDRPSDATTIPRHNLPILFLVQKSSHDEVSDALNRVVRVLEQRHTNREQVIKALTNLNDGEQLAEVVDGLDCRCILQRGAYRFEAVRYLLDIASEQRRCDLLLTDDCKMLRVATIGRSWSAFAWAAANLEGDALCSVEDAVLNLKELESCFRDMAQTSDFSGLKELSRALTTRVRKEYWRKVDYRGVFRAAVAAKDVPLVAELLRLFDGDDDVAQKSLFVGTKCTKCTKFFQALLQSPYRDAYFPWMLKRVQSESFRATVLSSINNVAMFQTAFVGGDYATLNCLASCTDAEKAVMKKSVSPSDCLRAFVNCLETRNNSLLQAFLHFVEGDEQQKVFTFLNVEVDGMFAFDLEPDMDRLWIDQICNDLDSFTGNNYDWSIWAHLLYALLRLQIRTQK